MSDITILSIDAWADMGGWQWNNWHKIGTIDTDTLDTLDTDEKVIAWLVSEGYLRDGVKLGVDVEIDDDQYNIVVCDRSVIDAGDCENEHWHECEHTHCAMPIIAIAYGEVS